MENSTYGRQRLGKGSLLYHNFNRLATRGYCSHIAALLTSLLDRHSKHFRHKIENINKKTKFWLNFCGN